MFYESMVEFENKVDNNSNPIEYFTLIKNMNSYDNNNIIIFDGVCNLCNRTIQLIIKIDKDKIFKFLPLQSEKADQLLKKLKFPVNKLETIMLLKDNQILIHSDAVLEITHSFKYPWKMLYFLKFVPKFLRNRIYIFIASNRYAWFGKKDTCMLPGEDIKSRFLK